MTYGSQQLLPNFQETLSESLVEKLNYLSFVEERIFCTITIERDENGNLGLQIAEGSDGNIYIQSVIFDGPAYKTKKVQYGDQVIAVNGKSLLGMKYSRAIKLFLSSNTKVEFVLARITPTKYCQSMSFNRIILPNPSEISHIKSDSHLSLVEQNIYPKLESPPLEKHLMESCHDAFFDEYFSFNKYLVDVPYHKHIRYEVDSTEKCANLKTTNITNPKYYSNETPSKHYSKNFNENKGNVCIVEMVPKDILNLSESQILDKNHIEGFQSTGKNGYEIFSPVALPRSLGLSRKWRGPVKYPVTPLKLIDDNEADNFSNNSISDEEQVFI